MLNDLESFDLNIPSKCEFCDFPKLKYEGVGEYRCEECGHIMLDDYGKVRAYIEKRPGATQSEVSKETGVSTSTIRRLLRDERIQIAPGSTTFLHCEICGADIRFGKMCENCQRNSASSKNSDKKGSAHIVGGFMKSKSSDGGEKRFRR